MRIALFTDTYPGDVNGVARTLGRLVEHARRRGHEVALVTPRVPLSQGEPAALHHRLPGVPIPIYPDLQLARGLDGEGRRMLERFRPELVHVATESTVGLSGRNWALRRGIPLVTSYHTHFAAYTRSYGIPWLEPLVWRYLRWFHARSILTFCPSRDTLEQLLVHGFHRRVRTWSRGVDTTLFAPSRRTREARERIAPGASHVMLYVGRIAAEKRVDLVLEAFERVRRDTGPETSLVLVGDGPELDALVRRAPSGVRFTGFLGGEELAEAYASADLFVFASETETFGNVVLEALASGVPAVVVDRGGVRETVVPGRTGLRVPPGDPRSFAEACIRLVRDGDLRCRLAVSARVDALSRSWPQVLDTLLADYELALSCARGEVSRDDLAIGETCGPSDEAIRNPGPERGPFACANPAGRVAS